MKQTLGVLLIAGVLLPSLVAGENGDLLDHGRQLFYAGVESEEEVREAIGVFREIAETDSSLRGKALTYIGASTALLGKHAGWPQKKYGYVIEGLNLMEKGIAISPKDLEAQFIYASTCYYLPFFFGKRKAAEQAFDRIVDLAYDQHQDYPDSLVINAMDFVRKHGDPNQDRLLRIRRIERRLDS